MLIAALEPYSALSHATFLEGLQRHSAHRIEIRSMTAHHWKWRMGTAPLHFARELEAAPAPDLLLVSDYLNLPALQALLPARMRAVPTLLYFHENQLTYPLQPGEKRDIQFALIHFYSCLAADAVAFNSEYHRRSFLDALGPLLSQAPNVSATGWIERIEERSRVLPLGTDLPARDPFQKPGQHPSPQSGSQSGKGAVRGRDVPSILWNHRWEYDKQPELFARTLLELAAEGVPFSLQLLGQSYARVPKELDQLKARLGSRLTQHGFLEERADYARALGEADIVFSTARHEFFGLSTLEALRSGALPVLPDGLAYPELLPPALRGDRRFLYPIPMGPNGPLGEAAAPLPTLRTAVEAVRCGSWKEERSSLVRFTDGFALERLIGAYDALFEALAKPAPPPL